MIAIPGRYDFKPYAYAFQKDSPYLSIFNYFIKTMQERGSMDQIMEKNAAAPQFCPDLTDMWNVEGNINHKIILSLIISFWYGLY